jgi:hypothetical protein
VGKNEASTMTHDELLAKIDFKIEYCTCEGWGNNCWEKENIPWQALRAVVELHKEKLDDVGRPVCSECFIGTSWRIYPCPTIRAIEEAVKL